jgi:hypothetical protein
VATIYQSAITLSEPEYQATTYLSDLDETIQQKTPAMAFFLPSRRRRHAKRARSKKAPGSAVVAVAEAAGRTLGAPNAVERVVGKIRPHPRPHRSSTDTQTRGVKWR